MKGLIIYSNGETKVVEQENDFTSDFIREIVGGDIQIVATNEGQEMIVNEDGMGLGLEPNEAAFERLHGDYKRPLGCTDQIFGNALILLKGKIK